MSDTMEFVHHGEAMSDIVYDDPKIQKEWLEFQKLTPEQMDKENDGYITDFLNHYPEHINLLVEVLDRHGIVGLKAKLRHNAALRQCGVQPS